MKRKTANIFCLLLALTVLGVITTGCSESGPEIYEVSGTISYQGEPIPNIDIIFVPEDTVNFKESRATSDDEGKFVMSYTYELDGVAPGAHTIYVEDPAALHGGQSSTDASYVAICQKYGSEETSTMTLTVDSDLVDHALDFE
jgi:hypothetical protein